MGNFKFNHSSPQNQVPQIRGLDSQNALMSPANNTNRHNLLNDTRGSMQSSLMKNDGRHHALNSSFGGVSGMSISQSNMGGMNMRILSNSSFDMKQIGVTSTTSNNTSIMNFNVNSTPQHARQLDQSSDVHEYQKVKQSAEQYHTKGYEARKKGDYEKAIKFYTEALTIMPNHFKALFNRGFAFDKLGEFDLAIQDYTTAINIDPQNAYTYYNKGISLDRKGDFDEAIICFTQAIDIEPTKADFYHNRGFAFRKKKEFGKAIKDYESAIKIDPKHFKAYYNRAFCWDKLNELEKSEQDYVMAV